MINISKRVAVSICAGVFAAGMELALNEYVHLVVHNTWYHFMFGYMDGIIVMGLIAMYVKFNPLPVEGGK
jgi:hypothetical protein